VTITMKIACLGGGPGGLYFAILIKKAWPETDVTVYERNKRSDTFGFGVVFSDATLANLGEADAESYAELRRHLAHWDDIDIHLKGSVLRSTGHGFCGCSRKALLGILERRAEGLGVKLVLEHEFTDAAAFADCALVVAADGVNSTLRKARAEAFEPTVEFRPNRFIWLGTSRHFPAFTFIFKESEHGLWRVHAYQYEAGEATFIVECTAETFARSGLDADDERAAAAYCEQLFARELGGAGLERNRSIWRNFPNVRTKRWHAGKLVLIGDAAHTAHFSIGSGTKLAMEDAIALAAAVTAHPGEVEVGLLAYETAHRPEVEAVQRAALVSQRWFEESERYYACLEPIQFAFSLLTRSLRISHENLKLRDPAFVAEVDRWFAADAANRSGRNVALAPPPPPMFTPFRLRELVLPNRVVVSPMCQYSALDGTISEWHLVHLGSRALGGAGLVMSEMTDVSREGRITPGCAGMYKPEHVAAWRRVVEFVHRESGAKIGMQLAHAGRKGATRLAWEGYDEPLDTGAWPIMAPSPLPYLAHSQVPRAMTGADMAKVREDFVAAARMAEAAGFDLLELHFAHGYLLSSFLSPLTNRRTDAYGGSLRARMRFPLEVFAAVRAAWPEAKPISVRISATDWVPGGFEGGDAVALAAALKKLGCDIIDVSAGQVVPEQEPVYGRLFQTPFAERVRLEAEIPTMTVGNISTFEDVNSVLAAGRADLCVLARAHLYDPYWTRHMATKQGYVMPWPKPYGPIEGYEPRFM
jgi:anthraniloyl-CoA monooxygenase